MGLLHIFLCNFGDLALILSAEATTQIEIEDIEYHWNYSTQETRQTL